jgi:NADH:ubiquinone oxidoreductase subunit 2 (subunit N)
MYKCYKKELIIFESFTDLLSSFLVCLSPIIFLVIFHLIFDNFAKKSFYNYLSLFSCLTSIPFLIFSIKCSINYNDKLFKIVISSLTKFFIPLLIVIAYILPNINRDRRKRRVPLEIVAKVASVTAVILMLVTNKSFKSIKDSWHGL